MRLLILTNSNKLILNVCYYFSHFPSVAYVSLGKLFYLFFQMSLSVGRLGGDGSGLLIAELGHELHLAFDKRRTHINAEIISRHGATLYMPSTVYFERRVDNYGGIHGIQHLLSRSSVRLYHTGFSVCQNKTGDLSEEGKYWFSSTTVLSESNMVIDGEYGKSLHDGMTLTMDDLYIEYTGVLYVKGAVTIHSLHVFVEGASRIDGIGRGDVLESGPGAGCDDDGAGHGGHGGIHGPCGHIYGDEILPNLPGSGGGTCRNAGGYGGSAIKIVSSHVIYLEGLITVDGQTPSPGAGGGSGGSLWLDADNLDGWGRTHSQGGDAFTTCKSYCTHSCCEWCYGGGGGGGRIKTYTPSYTQNVILQQRSVKGGVSQAMRHGGVGTLYIGNGQACSGNGTWNGTTHMCSCDEGYLGEDCQFECDAAVTCNGHGICGDYGQCVCHPGFVGYRCEHYCNDSDTCSGHGTCGPCGTCVCDPCYHGHNCSVLCSGSGDCVVDKCLCDQCHLGDYCESTCNSHGVCNYTTIPITCECSGSWRGDRCTLPGCPGRDIDCSGHGMCNAAEQKCYCDPGWTGKCAVTLCKHNCKTVLKLNLNFMYTILLGMRAVHEKKWERTNMLEFNQANIKVKQVLDLTYLQIVEMCNYCICLSYLHPTYLTYRPRL